MVYYSAVKNKDIIKCAGKWMELENIIFFYYPFSGGYFHTGFLAVAQSGLPKKPGSPPAATRKKGEKAVGRCWTQRTERPTPRRPMPSGVTPPAVIPRMAAP